MQAKDLPPQWASAMTYKIVGALRSLTDDKPYQRLAIVLGVAIGLGVQLVRKLVLASPGYQRWASRSSGTRAADFVIDAVVLPSPYAYSFGTFLGLATSVWFAIGGVIASIADWAKQRAAAQSGQRNAEDDLPSDMSTVSLLGGGLIAGDALAALGLGVAGLLATLMA
jgi:hypothetical protein